MASSGNATGGRPISNSPQLKLYWSQVRQDIPNNRTLVKLTLQLYSQYNIGFSGSMSGNLDGSSFSYTSGMSGTGQTRTIATREVWVNHNSDGRKSQSFSAWFDLKIRWSGRSLPRLHVSVTANLNTIPRGSALTAFSFSSSLKPNTAININYSVTRYSGNFRHQVQLRDGSTTLWTWDNLNSSGSSTIGLTAGNVNTLLGRLSNSTSRSLTLRVATRSGSGGGWIGSAVTRNATINVSSSVIPSASGMSVAIYGTGKDKTPLNQYIQSITRVTGSFTRSAGYGASISSSRIVIRRVSGGADSQTINSNSGTTSRAVNLSGPYEAIGTVRDSRGRENTSRTTFTVEAYNGPTINAFTVSRREASPTIVDIQRSITTTSLGSKNVSRVTIEKRTLGGIWGDATTAESWNGGNLIGTKNSTGISVTNSYEFRIIATDIFGNRAEAEDTVTTQKVVLDIHRNDGIGIGKIHERGELDIAGDVYVAPEGKFSMEFKSGKFLTIKPDGAVAFGVGADFRGDTTGSFFQVYHGGRINAHEQPMWYGGDGPLRDGDVEEGSNSNGHWIKFPNGVMLAWHYAQLVYASQWNLYRMWVFPREFKVHNPRVFFTISRDHTNFPTSAFGGQFVQANSFDRVTLRQYGQETGTRFSSGDVAGAYIFAIGRWY